MTQTALTQESIYEIMTIVAASDGPELAEMYGVICGKYIKEDDAHYKRDELLKQIESTLSSMNEKELESLIEFLLNQDDEEINFI